MPIQGNYYNAPGAAASDAIEQLLTERTQLARQGVEDRLRFMEFAQRMESAQQALKEKQQEHQDAMDEKDKQTTLKIIGGLQPGDVPDADTVAKAKKYHIPLPITVTQPTTTGLAGDKAIPESMPGIAAVPLGQAQTGVSPTREGFVPRPEQGPTASFRFAGTPEDRETRAFKQTLAGLQPGSKEYIAALVQRDIDTGKQPNAEMLKQLNPTAGAGEETVLIADPTRTKFQRLMPDGTLQPFSGAVPKGARIIEQPQPKDTSASEAAHELTKENQRMTAHERAIQELKPITTVVQGHLDAINDLGIAINQMTPQADALIAPLVLKATVSGQGTGFRMTQSEINQVVGGRSKWDSLEAALRKWDPSAGKALSISDEQRKELRSLAKAIRAKAAKRFSIITEARHKIDDAPDAKSIEKLQTGLMEKINEEDTAGEKKLTAEERLQQILAGTK